MKQYVIKSENLNKDDPDDAYLSPNDPIHELKIVEYLAGLGGQQRLAEYRAKIAEMNKESIQGSNISITGNEKRQIEKKLNIQPGTPEWFRLWFAKQYMTGEKPI